MKKLIILLALLVTTSFSFAAFTGLPANVEQNLGAIQKYSKAGSILLDVQDTYTLTADGAIVYERHEFRYLPDEAARDNFGDPHVPFVSGRDTLEILTARCYTQDGRQTDATPHNAYNPIIPEGLDKAPDYSAFRQMVVTLLGLENKSIAELHYRITTPKPLFPWLEGRVYFREDNPVIARTLVVKVPEGTTLTYAGDRGMAEPKFENGVYTWTGGEAAGYLKEDLAGHRIVLPNVAFTTAAGWEPVQSELHARVSAAMQGDLALPASLKTALAGQATDEARLNAIKGWLHARFPDLSETTFEHPDFPLTLRSAARVLQSGYGNDLEQAVLLAKLASVIGIKSDVIPFFVPASPVPSLHEYAGTVLALHGPAHGLYVHPRLPAAEFTGADLVGAWLLPLTGDDKEPVQYTNRLKNPAVRLFVSYDDITADTLQGHGTLSATGEWGLYEALREGGPAEYLNGAVRANGFAVSKATVRDLESPASGAVVVDFNFTAAALDTADGARVLPLALWDFARLTPEAPLGLATREFRQDVPMPAEMRLHVEAPVPAGWQVAAHPASLLRAWDFDRGSVACDVKDGRLVYERTLELTKDWIPAASWPDYRAFVLDSGPTAKNCAIFAPAKATAAK